MVDQELLNALNDCIDALAEGRTVEQAIRRYPEYAAALRPLLEAGLTTRQTKYTPFEISASQDRVRVRFQASLAETRQRQKQTGGLWSSGLVRAATLLLVAGSLVLGAATAAESSLPGDALYGVKLLTESLRADSMSDSRRRDEIRQLQALGRSAEVEFRGLVISKSDDVWDVSGISTRVLPDTPGSANAGIGDTVEISAQVNGPTVFAQQVTVVFDQPDPLPQSTEAPPTPEPNPTLPPTLEPSPTLLGTLEVSTTPTGCQMPVGWVRYTVRVGDSLSLVAAAANSTIDEIAEANCLENTRLINLGQVLFLPETPVFPATPVPTSASVQPNATPSSENSNVPPVVNSPPSGQGEDLPDDEDVVEEDEPEEDDDQEEDENTGASEEVE